MSKRYGERSVHDTLCRVSLTREAFFAERGHCLKDLLQTRTEAADPSDDLRLIIHQRMLIRLLIYNSPGTF